MTDAGPKPIVIVGTLGHVDTGKRALGVALAHTGPILVDEGSFRVDAAPMPNVVEIRVPEALPEATVDHKRRGKGDRRREPRWPRR